MTLRRGFLQAGGTLAAAVLCATGCTGTTEDRPATPSSLTAPARPPVGGASDGPVLRCGSNADGDLGSDWQRDAMAAGPLAIVGGRQMSTGSLQQPPAGRVYVVKALIVVQPGKTVTLTIGDDAREHASLDHASRPPSDGIWTLQNGVPSVRFEACPSVETQFPGDILLDAPRCLPLQAVEADGASQRVVLSLGAGPCPAEPSA